MPYYVRYTSQRALYARAFAIAIYVACAFTPLLLIYWLAQETSLYHDDIITIVVVVLIGYTIVMFALDRYLQYIPSDAICYWARSVDTDFLLSACASRDAHVCSIKPCLVAVADVLSAGTNYDAINCFNEMNKRLCEHDKKMVLRALWSRLIELEPSILQRNIDLHNFMSYISA
ncbi:MAG: hypothetical protein WB816_03200 [Methylocystis sp.]